MINPIKFLSKFIRSNNQKELDKIDKIVLKVNSLEKEISVLSQNQFKDKTEKLIKQLSNGKSLNEILPVAYALVRESSKEYLMKDILMFRLLGSCIK